MPSLPIPPPTRTAQGEAFLQHTARMAPPQETRPGPQDKVPVAQPDALALRDHHPPLF